MTFISISSEISKDRLNTASKASALNQCWPWDVLQDMPPSKLLKRQQMLFSNIYSATTLNFFLSWSEPSQDSRASESPACRLHPRLHSPSGDLPSGPPLVPPPGPPGQRDQLPAGGSLMPRFKCKFPGHRAPTAGPTTTLELLNGGGGDSTDDVSTQGAWPASKHATHRRLATLTTFASDETSTNKCQSGKKSVNFVLGKCELLRCLLTEWWGRVWSLGSNCSWQSKIGSKIDPWGPVRPV